MPAGECDSLFVCFVFIVKQAYNIGGLGRYFEGYELGIGDGVKVGESFGISVTASELIRIYSIGRYLFDILFTVVILMVLVNMKFAFFIDVFSRDRTLEVNLQKDKNNICFICGLDRETLDKIYLDKNGFNKHLEDHDLINYFLFLFYLNEKDYDELTGLESFTLDMIRNESIDWFPMQRCIKMEKNN